MEGRIRSPGSLDPGTNEGNNDMAHYALAAALVVAAVSTGSSFVGAQSQNMSFFITSVGPGHHDRQGGGANPTSWNSAHGSRGCSQENLRGSGGDGLYYCFAR